MNPPLTRELSLAILRHGGYDPAAALDAYVHWYRSGPFDMGGSTSSALRPSSPSPDATGILWAARGRPRPEPPPANPTSMPG